jgi:hypothetical protein
MWKTQERFSDSNASYFIMMATTLEADAGGMVVEVEPSINSL